MPKETKKKRGSAKKKGGPKRGLSAFMFFSKAKREEVKAEDPDLTFGQVGAELGRLWRELSDEDKEPYQKLATADKERYLKEKAEFEAKAADADEDEDDD